MKGCFVPFSTSYSFTGRQDMIADMVLPITVTVNKISTCKMITTSTIAFSNSNNNNHL